MNGESAVGFKMKIRIHNEGGVEAMKNSSPPPAPLPCWIITTGALSYLDV